MKYALKERIGNPELFTGRKEELAFFLDWINQIKERNSQSTALLARRNMGKTALMQRFFNITYYKNDGVIPFYYEIRETPMWIGDFCKDFFLTFIYQYIAFKTRKKEYLTPLRIDFKEIAGIAQKEGLSYLVDFIQGVEHEYVNEYIDTLWLLVRDAPRKLAILQDEFIVQMIDEFQLLNTMIYRDKGAKNLTDTLSGSYLSTAESKVSPLLISINRSRVAGIAGWQMDECRAPQPWRFRYQYLGNMPEDEAIEMIYKYCNHFNVPVTEETAYMMVQMSEGNPFYIDSIIRSSLRNKDLTSIQGLTKTLEFETLNNRGTIRFTWMNYIAVTLPQITDHNVKRIILHLCKHRDRELTRAEILQDLKLEMSDADLEKKLKELTKADIITQGQTNYDYCGLKDNIFDKVFRGIYEEEIQHLYYSKENGFAYSESIIEASKEPLEDATPIEELDW